jgi:LSD1 subclass zinc finger protein
MDDLVEERLRCKGCGAGLKYSGGSLALECEYCDTVTEIERPQDRPEGVPELVVPLAVDEDALRKAVYTAMTKGDYTPDDMLEQAVFSRLERFYVPAYLFKGSYEAAWTASFGFDRTEHYTEYETQHSNGESRQVPVTRTRTVTDWTPVSGKDVGSFAVLGYAGTRLPERAIALAESCAALGRATPYAPAFSSGVEMEAVAATGKDAYDRRGLPQVTALIDRSVKAHAQGSQQRDWHFKAVTDRDKPVPIAIPICHAVFEYGGQSYHVWADGTDAGRQAADPLPQDKARRARVNRGYLPPVLTAAALACAGLQQDPPGPFQAVSVSSLCALAAACCFSAWRRHVILSHSRRTRQAMLAARTAAFGRAAAPISPSRKPWALDRGRDIAALTLSAAIGCAWALGLPASWYPALAPAPAAKPAPVTSAASPAPAAPAIPQEH